MFDPINPVKSGETSQNKAIKSGETSPAVLPQTAKSDEKPAEESDQINLSDTASETIGQKAQDDVDSSAAVDWDKGCRLAVATGFVKNEDQVAKKAAEDLDGSSSVAWDKGCRISSEAVAQKASQDVDGSSPVAWDKGCRLAV